MIVLTVQLNTMPAPLLSRAEVIDRLIDVFRNQGYEGASLTDLSKATGLGRSSLYHYFPGGKEEMVQAALERLEQWLHQEVVEPLRGAGSPQERLQQMIGKFDGFYDTGRSPCLLGALVTGESRRLFHPQLQGAFSTWVAAIAQLLEEVGFSATVAQDRAEDAVIRIQGALVLSGGLGDNQPFKRLVERLPLELLAPISGH